MVEGRKELPETPIEEKNSKSTVKKSFSKSKCDYFHKNKENLMKSDKYVKFLLNQLTILHRMIITELRNKCIKFK